MTCPGDFAGIISPDRYKVVPLMKVHPHKCLHIGGVSLSKGNLNVVCCFRQYYIYLCIYISMYLPVSECNLQNKQLDLVVNFDLLEILLLFGHRVVNIYCPKKVLSVFRGLKNVCFFFGQYLVDIHGFKKTMN